MPLVPAKCTECGASLEVNSEKECTICSFCGTPFITEKAINNYVTNHNATYNVTENVTKIIYGNEKDEGSDHFNRGLSHLKLKDYRSAHVEFVKACELSPENEEYWFYNFYAYFYWHKGSLSDSIIKFFALADDSVKEKLHNLYGYDFSSLERLLVDILEPFYSSEGHYHSNSSLKHIRNFYVSHSKKEKNNPLAVYLAKQIEITPVGLDLEIAKEIIGIIRNDLSEEYTEKFDKEGFYTYIANPLDKLGNLCVRDYKYFLDKKTNSIKFDDERIKRVEVECYIEDFMNLTLVLTKNINEIIFLSKKNTNIGTIKYEEGCAEEMFLKYHVLSHHHIVNSNMKHLCGECVGCWSIISCSEGTEVNLTYSDKEIPKFKVCSTLVIGNKIIYPQYEKQLPLYSLSAMKNEIFKWTNELLMKFYGNEIKSGKITGYCTNFSKVKKPSGLAKLIRKK